MNLQTFDILCNQKLDNNLFSIKWDVKIGGCKYQPNSVRYNRVCITTTNS
jgi:hypothetical protein